MFLAKPEVIETLNAYYIPIALDVFLPESSMRWYHKLKAELVPTYPFAKGPSAWIVSPEGKPLRCIDVKVLQHRMDEALAELKAVVAEQGIVAGKALRTYMPQELKHKQAGDLALHVTTRFLLDYDLNGLDGRVPVSLEVPPVPAMPAPILPVKDLFRIRLLSPIDEWCLVPAAQKAELLPPPGAGPGSSYTIPPRTAAIIYRRLCPPTFNAHLDGLVLDARMVGMVRSVGEETRVELRGAFASEHQLWGGKDENIAEGRVVGYLAFDSSSRDVTRFGMTTDPGVYGDRRGFRVPFVATAELWKSDRPSVAAAP